LGAFQRPFARSPSHRVPLEGRKDPHSGRGPED
jgi:hypothetical protein